MEIAGYALLSLAGLTVLIFIAWRLASRRQSLPCPVWLRWFVELDNPFTKTNRAAFIIEHLEIEPGMTVLDVGCGPGRLAIPAAKQVGLSWFTVNWNLAGLRLATGERHRVERIAASCCEGLSL